MSTREQIVDAADRLFYEQGYAPTSFALIADAVGISRGNFYYHFKTKDEILAAVIEARLAHTRRMLAGWEGAASPLERVRRFVEIVLTNGADIENYGCPVGTLTNELAKLGHPLRAQAVGVFNLFRDWLREQFTALGRTAQADDLAMYVLMFSQGVATLSNAFGERAYVQREVQRLNAWLSAQFPDAGGAARAW